MFGCANYAIVHFVDVTWWSLVTHAFVDTTTAAGCSRQCEVVKGLVKSLALEKTNIKRLAELDGARNFCHNLCIGWQGCCLDKWGALLGIGLVTCVFASPPELCHLKSQQDNHVLERRQLLLRCGVRTCFLGCFQSLCALLVVPAFGVVCASKSFAAHVVDSVATSVSDNTGNPSSGAACTVQCSTLQEVHS
eukprot:793719-Amphidinium_carterae.1